MSIKKIIASAVAFSLVFGSVCYYNDSIPNFKIISSAEESTEYTEGICGSMTYKKYSDHIEISNCKSSVYNVIIPDEIEGLPVTVIGQKAFYNCLLSSITIPENVIKIDNCAFYYCPLLCDIKIPESVTHIGNSAFYKCTSLTDITIPESVSSIGYSAFESCDNLQRIIIKNSYSKSNRNIWI